MSYSNLQQQLQLFIKNKLYQNDYSESNHFSEDFIDAHLNRHYYHLAIILRNANDKTDNNLLILLANIKYYIDFIIIQTIINCYILYYDDTDVIISTLIINYFNIIKINPNLSNKVMRVYGLLYNAIVINKLKLNYYTKDNYKDFDIDKFNKSDLKDLEEKAKLTDDYIQEFKKDYDDFLKLKKNKDELTIKRLDEIAKISLKDAAELIFKLFHKFEEKINRYFDYLKIQFNNAIIDQNYMNVSFSQEENDRAYLKEQIDRIENFKLDLISKYHIPYSDENKIETITQEDIIEKLNDIKNNYNNPNELKKISDIKNYRFTKKENEDEDIKVIIDLILKLNKTFKDYVIDNKEEFDIQLKTLGFILDKLIEINDNMRNNNVIFYFTGKNIYIDKQRDDDALLSNIILSKLFNDLKNKKINHIIINLLLDIIFKVYNSKNNTINFDDIMIKLYEYLEHKRDEYFNFNKLYEIQNNHNFHILADFISDKDRKLIKIYENWSNRSYYTWQNIIMIYNYINDFKNLLNKMIVDTTIINKNIKIALEINTLIQYILFILNENVIEKRVPITDKDELRRLFDGNIRGGGNGNINYLNILRIKTLNLIFKENLDNLKEFSNEIYSDQYRNENLILDEYN